MQKYLFLSLPLLVLVWVVSTLVPAGNPGTPAGMVIRSPRPGSEP